jgi:hypothetical protein
LLSFPHDTVPHPGASRVPLCVAMRNGVSDVLVPLPVPVFQLSSPERQGTCHFQSDTAPPRRHPADKAAPVRADVRACEHNRARAVVRNAKGWASSFKGHLNQNP